MKAIVMFCIMLVAGSAAIGLIAHEGTHLALANEAHGICVGMCRDSALPQSAFGLAYGDHNETSQNELYANIAGIGTAAAFAIATLVTITPKLAAVKK